MLTNPPEKLRSDSYDSKGSGSQNIEDFGSITPIEAFKDLGITKLATVVSKLRLKDGVEIAKESVKVKNRYGKSTTIKRYSFPKKEA